MTNNDNNSPLKVDMHFHVGLRGDLHTGWGGVSDDMRKKWPEYDTFLLFAGIKKGEDTDEKITEKMLEIINNSSADKVVCLALDHVYEKSGTPREDLSDFWVANDYVLHLQKQPGSKVLYGASVHPYDPDFKDRVNQCVEDGAVLLKWLPSSQQFSLADTEVREALEFLATAKHGKPLPLLLHTGVEYAVPTADERTRSFDFLSWSAWDAFWNFWRFGKKWHTPNIPEVLKTIDAGLAAGCFIIFAHCGLPYVAPSRARWLEHDDFPVVSRYLRKTAAGETAPGRCYADLSACVTPFRKTYFEELRKLPPELLLFGSDYPTPAFEIFADAEEVWKDFQAVLRGDLKRIVIPQGNMIDVNLRELNHAFPGHPMFTNFDRYLL